MKNTKDFKQLYDTHRAGAHNALKEFLKIFDNRYSDYFRLLDSDNDENEFIARYSITKYENIHIEIYAKIFYDDAITSQWNVGYKLYDILKDYKLIDAKKF